MLLKHNYSRFLFLHLCGLLFLYGALLVKGQTLYYRDILITYWPNIEFIRESIWSGQWPFWHPRMMLGTPLMAALEPPVFYPIAWLFLLPFDFPQLLALNLIVHHFIAATGIFLFCQRLHWRFLPILTASVCFSFGGLLVSMNNIHPLMNTVAWIPFVFWATHCICHEEKVQALCVFAGVYALQILSGHLDIVYAQSLAVLLYALFILIQRSSLKGFFLMAGASCLGVLLGMLQLLPSLKYAAYTARHQGVGLEQSQYWSFHPAHLAQLILPELKQISELNHAWHNIFNEVAFAGDALFYSYYLGVLGGGLLLYALYRFRQHQNALDFYALLSIPVLCTLIALGKYFPLYAWLYDYLPGFSFFRYPVKYFVLSYFVLCMLIGFGAERLLQDIEQAETSALKFWFVIMVCVFVSLTLLALFIQPQGLMGFIQSYRHDLSADFQHEMSEFIYHSLNRQFRYVLLFILLIALLSFLYFKKQKPYLIHLMGLILCLDVLGSSKHLIWAEQAFKHQPLALQASNTLRPPQHQYRVSNPSMPMRAGIPPDYRSDLKELKQYRLSRYRYDFLQPDMATNFGLYQMFSYWQGMSAQVNGFKFLYIKAFEEGFHDIIQSLETLFAVKYILLTSPAKNRFEHYKHHAGYRELRLDAVNRFAVFENTQALPRARFQTQALIVKSKEMAQHAILYPQDSGFDAQKHVVLERNAALEQALKEVPVQAAQDKQWSPPQIMTAANQLLRISFETNSSGYLVLADQYLPGWSAYDNGKPVPILTANSLMRAVRVGPGQHEIEFRYRPPGLKWGLVLSCLGGLIWLLVLLFPIFSEKRKAAGVS